MTPSLDDIRIRPFVAADQDAVRELVVAGLRERWGQFDPQRNGDLDDIAASYPADSFLVAWDGDHVIGTGALVRRDPSTAEIKRMSVARHMRRRGIGRLMLRVLLMRAHAQSFRNVILETTSTWQDAIDFYLTQGFRITHFNGGDTYFRVDLD